MLKKKKDAIEWLEFELLKEFPEVKQAVFLKAAAFDLGEKGPKANQEKVLKIFDLKKGVKLKQVHQDGIYEIKNAALGWVMKENFDGMITQEKKVGLLIRHADCQATIFYDPLHQALANVHCGWRGSVKNIYQKVVEKMRKCYGTDPRELRVCIAPSLGPEAAEFRHFKSNLPESFWKYQVRPNYFDFWAISRAQLLDLGVQEKHIEIAGICTYQNQELCFSYRRNKQTGHHGTLVALSN